MSNEQFAFARRGKRFQREVTGIDRPPKEARRPQKSEGSKGK